MTEVKWYRRIPWDKLFLCLILLCSAILGYWAAAKLDDSMIGDQVLTRSVEEPEQQLETLEIDSNWDSSYHWKNIVETGSLEDGDFDDFEPEVDKR